MEHKYKWIAQDMDGAIWFFNTKPDIELAFNAFYAEVNSEGNSENKKVEAGKPNPNWRDSLIDLEKEDYEIVDGILTRKPRAEVLTSELTDTELLDAIMEYGLIVDREIDGSVLVWKVGYEGIDVTNKKGNIRKAIKKWLRKNT